MAEIDDLREELERLKAPTSDKSEKIQMTSGDIVRLVIAAPVVAAFVILGIIIVWSTTQNPASVAPHLDIILVAYAIFATPTTAGLAAITGRFSREGNKE